MMEGLGLMLNEYLFGLGRVNSIEEKLDSMVKERDEMKEAQAKEPKEKKDA